MRGTSVVVAAAAFIMAWTASGPGSAQTASQTPGAQQYPHQLTGAEVRARVSDSTAYTAGNFGPKTYAVYYSAGGQIKIRSPDFQDVGTYRITDDGQFCTKYNKMRNGQETCQTLWQTGPDAFENHLPNGQIIKSTGRAPGNPEGL
jgi:hypothetical protein